MIDLKEVGESMRLSRSKLDKKHFKFGFTVDILISPSKKKLSYSGLRKFKLRSNSLRNERSFCEGGF